MKKRIFSLLLALVLLFNLTPISAFEALAAGNGAASVTEPTESKENEYIEGMVTVECNGESAVTLKKGDKLYAFAKTNESLGDTLRYTWEMMTDSGNWATVSGYIFYYAVISDALITNAKTKDGIARLRCIVEASGVKYVSNVLAVSSAEQAQTLQRAEDDVLFSAPTAQDEGTSGEGSSREGSLTMDAYHIVINYTYRHENPAPGLALDDEHTLDGATAANTFAVTLPEHSFYTGTVATPPEVGYLPYVKLAQASYITGVAAPFEVYEADGKKYVRGIVAPLEVIEYGGVEYVLANSIDFKEQKTDITIEVYFIPQLVTFRVKMYEQNLYDDEYTLAQTLTYTRYANARVGEDCAPARTGFSALYYDDDLPVSEDGSFALEVYYDRNYYLVEFDMAEGKDDGAYGATNLYVRYNSTIRLPEPTYPAHSFVEWQLDKVTDENKNAVSTHSYPDKASGGYMIPSIAQNLVYKAVWQEETTSYTVIYWLENADDPSFTLDSFKVVSDVKPGSIVSAKDDLAISDASCFTFSEVLSDKNIKVASDGTTAVNVYYLRNYYTMTFSGTAACITKEHTHGDDCLKGNCTLSNHTHTEECGIAEQTCDKEEHVHEDECCEIEEHEHTDAAAGGCCDIPYHVHGTGASSDCTKPEHPVHHDACYSRNALKEADTLTNNSQKSAYSGLMSKVSGPLNGYVYRYRYNRTIYNFIYVHNHWFYLGTSSDYNGVTVSISNPSSTNGSYTSAQASAICGYEVHTHGDGSCTCPITEHDHTTGCTCEDPRHVHGEGECRNTVCGKEQHVHSVGCYTYACGTEAHTHNADCVRSCQQLEHTHTTSCSQEKSQSFLSFKCKYNADMSRIWPSIWEIFSDGERWKDSKSAYFKQVLVYLPFMPPANITFTADTGTAKEIYNISYYLESVGTTGTYFEEYDKYFDLNNTVNANYNYLTPDEDFFDIPGFTQYASDPAFKNDQIETNNGGPVSLYYSRNEYLLEFVSMGTTLSPFTKTLKYQQPIGESFELLAKDVPYPSNKETGAIQFAGWYTTPNCARGTEFIFDGSTIMPIGGLVLYAKWVDCSYTVNIYSNVEHETLLSTQTVVFDSQIIEPAHTTKAPTLSVTDETQYIFAGWYYKDGTEEKRFDFNTMTVKRDMEIYAKWTSRIPINYVIRYVYWNGSEYVDIAERSTGASLAGITKSFTAKVGNELDEDYQVNYFPEVRAHSMTMSSEEAENEFLFIYSSPSEIEYTIIHTFTDKINGSAKARGVSVFEELFGANTLTMSTTYFVSGEDIKKRTAYTEISFREGLFEEEIFKAAKEQYGVDLSDTQKEQLISTIEHMSPNKFIQKLILTTDNDKNVAQFNWENAGVNQARYQILYYTESVDGSEYILSSSEEGVAAVGTSIDVELNTSLIKNIEYFELDKTNPNTILRGTVKAMEFDSQTGGLQKGLVLRLYYTRMEYPYRVYHYKSGSTIELADPTESMGKYESEVAIADVAKEIAGYTLVNGADVETIGEGDNSIICYYQGLEVYYQYQILGTNASVDVPSETVTIGGKAPSANELSLWNDGVFLNAWYYSIGNGERKAVPAGWISNNGMVITPAAPEVELAGKTVYIYAEVLPFTRRFRVEGYASPENDPQAFVFRLVGKPGTQTAGIDITFIIFDDGYTDIKHLPYGEYTLTTLHWAWRLGHPLSVSFNDEQLDADSGTVTLKLTESGEVVITYSPDEMDKWLSDDASGVVPME